MENSRCKAFIECVNSGSIKGAADTLGYTPSAISQLITAFEKELGLKLFVRTQRGVILTQEGRELVPLVRSYLEREQEIYRYAAETRGITMGKITIATYPSVATTWLPEIVRRFKNDYPGIQFSIRECIREDIFHYLDQNEADLGFLAWSEPMPYDWIPLAEEQVIAAVPEDHPLAGAASFPVRECENYDFILGSWGRELEILNILEQNDAHPEIKYTTYDTPATMAMVRMGLGISFVNALSAQYWNEHLVKMPLDPPASIEFGIAVPSREHMTSAAKKFLDYAVSYMADIEK
ncbi:MAG: LysR family transcriptional regulator [Mogibacterium sp.]|nr:LysR family transcriptional regulator [Mogibacterium sp.]